MIGGLVLEGPELIYDMLSIARTNIRRFRYSIILLENHVELAKVAAFVGWIFIIVGLFGELKAGSKIADLSASIQECSDAKVREATLEAGEARDSAASAKASEEALEKKAAALDIRLESAAKQLGTLEQDIRAQGPRWRLLKKAAPELVKQFAPFAGQRVRFFVCGRLGSQDGETLSTWGAIAEMLDTDGAKWKVEHGGLEYFDRGCSPSGGQPLGQGMMVFVNKEAPERTMKAAKALGEGLAKVLPPSPDKMPGLIDPDFSKKYIQPIEDKDTPWAMVANDPDLITILIGAHPQQEAATSKTKANH